MRTLQKSITALAGTIFLGAFCGAVQGQSLTTIQDTLFAADGGRFNGTLTIQWSTFDATSLGTVIQQSKSVPVANGNLQVQLTPNIGAPPPANIYTVMYQSDGRQQFTEIWTVPPSAAPLAVSQVRTGVVSSGAGGSGSASNSTPITESSVLNLPTDLNQRPTKGPGYGLGAVAFVNQSGQIETVAGSSGDCVLVDGTTGPCSAAPAFFDAETPGGLVDGSNLTFTLANAPSGTSLQLFRNGLYLSAGLDYTLSGSTIQFAAGQAPQPLDTLIASYRQDPGAGSAGSLQTGAGSALAQVLCSASGASTRLTSWVSLGSCNISSALLQPGDRIEIRFNFAHTGTASGYDVQVNWGNTTILGRSGGTQDAALVGEAEAAVSTGGTLITVQSYGTVLAFLPGIVAAPAPGNVTIGFLARVSVANTDSIALGSYTVLRYSAR